MDDDTSELQVLAIKILNTIDEMPTASYHIILGALALVLVTTFRAIKEDHGLQVMKQVKVDFYTFFSNATKNEGTVKREDLN